MGNVGLQGQRRRTDGSGGETGRVCWRSTVTSSTHWSSFCMLCWGDPDEGVDITQFHNLVLIKTWLDYLDLVE